MTGYLYLGPGGQVEVPVRSAELPINIWQRRSSIDTTDSRPSQDETQGSWKRKVLTVAVDVAAGDTVLRASVVLSIAGAFRREQGWFDLGFPDTNDWGMAFGGADPSAIPFTGPGSLQLQAQLSTRGKAWPGSVGVITDLLILRAGVIQDDPPPFTTAVPPHRSFASPLTQAVDWQTYDPFRH